MIDDIPIPEGEEMWAQEVIDGFCYKVTYYGYGTNVISKTFPTFEEAIKFSHTLKSGSILEIKKYYNETR